MSDKYIERSEERITAKIAEELGIKVWQVSAVIELIDGGSTIPFIARYRKEATGALDDETLRTLDERLKYLRNLEDRKETVLSSIDEQGKLTEELRKKIELADTHKPQRVRVPPFRLRLNKPSKAFSFIFKCRPAAGHSGIGRNNSGANFKRMFRSI